MHKLTSVSSSGLHTFAECDIPSIPPCSFVSVHDYRPSRGEIELKLHGPSTPKRLPVRRRPA